MKSGGIFDVPKLQESLADLDKQMAESSFWDSKEKAQEVVTEVSRIKSLINPVLNLNSKVEDVITLSELALEEKNVDEAQSAISEHDEIIKELKVLELRQIMGEEHDRCNAYVSIHAGAGGTESCDWANMLQRMFQRYSERVNLEWVFIDMQQGEEVGIRSMTAHVKGDYAYGLLKVELGVHRLVRISPFDSNAKRHTSFVSVDVTPDLPDNIEIEINDKDLRLDTYRSGGKGGQNVNKVETGVRYTHLPTGVVVACTSDRSQLKNKNTAMKLLKAKLFQREQDKKLSEMERKYSEKGEIGWGNQIRSYVLQPYQMIKDHRTNYQTSDIDGVLDGDIGAFIEERLRQLALQKNV